MPRVEPRVGGFKGDEPLSLGEGTVHSLSLVGIGTTVTGAPIVILIFSNLISGNIEKFKYCTAATSF